MFSSTEWTRGLFFYAPANNMPYERRAVSGAAIASQVEVKDLTWKYFWHILGIHLKNN